MPPTQQPSRSRCRDIHTHDQLKNSLWEVLSLHALEDIRCVKTKQIACSGEGKARFQCQCVKGSYFGQCLEVVAQLPFPKREEAPRFDGWFVCNRSMIDALKISWLATSNIHTHVPQDKAFVANRRTDLQ